MNKYLDEIICSSLEAILKVMISPYAENLEFISGHIKYSNYYEVVGFGGWRKVVWAAFLWISLKINQVLLNVKWNNAALLWNYLLKALIQAQLSSSWLASLGP